MRAPLMAVDRGTRLVALIGATAAVVIALLWSSFASAMSLWSLSVYRYAYLIFPVSAYLLWQQRGALAAQPVRPSWIGCTALLLLVAAWMVGQATHVRAIEHLTVMLMVSATVLAVFGTAVFRVAAFPLLLLVAAAPIYEPVVPPLMVITAEISEWLLVAAGQPFLRHGQYFDLPGGRFVVADVCAGLRYLLAGVVTATVFAHVNYASLRKQLLFVAVAAAAFILANSIRAFTVMYLHSQTGGRLFGDGHQGFGLVLFGAVMLALIVIGLRFADPPTSVAAATEDQVRPLLGRGSTVAAVVSLCILLVAPLSHARRQALVDVDLQWPDLPAIPECEAGGWAADWGPFMVGSDAERAATYRCQGAAIDVFIAAYGTQREGKELVSSGNELIPRAVSDRSRRSRQSFDVPEGGNVEVMEYELLGDRAQLVWRWYSVGQVPASSELDVKLQEALNALRFGTAPSAVYVVAVRGDLASMQEARKWAGTVAEAIWQASGPGQGGS